MSAALITHKTTTKTIQDLVHLHANDQLNLNPGFQRQSVWTLPDRVKLIDSILRNYPLPAIFLYKREDDGHLVYDVIDGKQRLESIFLFMGEIRGRFATYSQLPGSESVEKIDWPWLKRKGLQPRITGYEIPVVEVNGDLGDIIDLFIRINSTGKALTPQEKRNALYNNSPFLREAVRLATRYESYFLEQGILTEGQLNRMKHVEFMCELMLSLHQGDVLNKKTMLDRVMAASPLDGRHLKKASGMATATLNRVKVLFPDLKTTRLSQITDFYTLAVLIGKFEQEGLILTDRKRNHLAWDLLKVFSTRVDEVRQLLRKAKGSGPDSELYREYLLTVMQATDEVSQRRKRENIIRGILESVFAKRDEQRGFTPEQRRILWNGAENRVCNHTGCRTKLTWSDFTIDHITPYSRGGASELENAALMCREHNSAKGNRSR